MKALREAVCLSLIHIWDNEIRNVIRILSRKTKNNPVLIGEPGAVSYTHLVVELSVEGNEDEEIAETQRQAFINFNESKGILTNEIEYMIYDYYQSQCQEYRNMFEEQMCIRDRVKLICLLFPGQRLNH